MYKAVFLDRDGVIVEDVGYLNNCADVKIIPKSAEAIKILKDNGFKVYVVTNQAGLAKGYLTVQQLLEINKYIEQLLLEEKVILDGIFYCPHHPDGVVPEYTMDCLCRKPKPGLIEYIVNAYNIDLTKSFMVGDKISDVEAGCRAGCRSMLISSVEKIGVKDLYQIAKYIIKE